jgi:hypothetical protein
VVDLAICNLEFSIVAVVEMRHLDLRRKFLRRDPAKCSQRPSTWQAGGGEVLLYRREATGLERLVLVDDDSARMAAVSFGSSRKSVATSGSACWA